MRSDTSEPHAGHEHQAAASVFTRTAADVRRVIDTTPLPLANEKRFQAALADALNERGISAKREVTLSRGNIVDITLGQGIILECKIKAGRVSKRAVYRQLVRYARHPDVTGIILVSGLAMGLPETIEGRPAIVLRPGGAWL